MSIRITETCDGDGTVLRLDGWLASEDVEELIRACHSAQGPVVLELMNLQSASSSGVEALLELASLGVRVRGASTFIELLMKARRGVD
jgi:anti-anti-sigma regulatory factor